MPSSVIELEVNGEPQRVPRPARHDAAERAARHARPDRRQARLRRQGTCGTCTCLLDGDAVMSCLIPVETDQRLDGQDARGHDAAPTGVVAAPAGVPGRLRHPVRLLHAGDDHGRRGAAGGEPEPDARGRRARDLRQRLPLHGLREHHPAPSSTPARRCMTQRLPRRRQARPAPRTRSGHVTGRTQFFEDINPAGLLHLKMHRSERHHAKLVDVDVSAALRRHGRREGPHAQGRAEQLVHDPQADQRRLRRRARAGRGQGALPGRADRRRRRHVRARRARGRRRRQGHLRGPRAGASTSRRRSRPTRPCSSRTARTTSSTRTTTAGGSASATSRQGFAEADHVFEWRYQSRADRARADGDDGLHRRARRATAA